VTLVRAPAETLGTEINQEIKPGYPANFPPSRGRARRHLKNNQSGKSNPAQCPALVLLSQEFFEDSRVVARW
jgi:hypothetical protein